MRRLLLLLIAMTSFCSYGQVTTVFNNCFNTTALAIHNQYLYIGCTFDGIIYRLNVTQPNSQVELYKSGVQGIQGFCIIDNYLYVTLMPSPSNQRRVARLNLNMPNPPIENIVNLVNPNGIANDENYLYVNDSQKIYRIPLDVQNPSAELIINNLGVNFGTNGMVVINNFLYATKNGNLLRFNLNANFEQTTVLSGFENLTGLTKGENNQTLYMLSWSTGLIYKVNLNNFSSSVVTPSNLITAWDVIYNDNLLYACNFEGGQVNRFDLSQLSLDENVTNSFKMYPNPANEIYTVRLPEAEMTGSEMILKDLTGKEILRMALTEEETSINVGFLSPGIYLVQFDYKNKTWVEKLMKK